MHNVILVRYGEISLKGKNRGDFEKKLVENIKRCLDRHHISYTSIARPRNRIIIHTNQKCDKLAEVYGIASFSYVIQARADIAAVKREATRLIAGLNQNSKFRVTAKRLDQSTRFTSRELNNALGRFIEQETKARVDLEHYDFELGIEILEGKAFLFTQKIPGPGGLPVGVEGRVLVLKEGDWKRAADLMQKRGCQTIAIDDLKETPHHKDARALVVAQTLEDFKKIESKLPVLRPLIAK